MQTSTYTSESLVPLWDGKFYNEDCELVEPTSIFATVSYKRISYVKYGRSVDYVEHCLCVSTPHAEDEYILLFPNTTEGNPFEDDWEKTESWNTQFAIRLKEDADRVIARLKTLNIPLEVEWWCSNTQSTTKVESYHTP